jgi:predicted DCC family thiol-disulfide oxidoreductase YuxK
MTWLSADRRLIHSEATPGALALARIWVFGVWTTMAAGDSIPLRAELPADLAIPIGLLRLMPDGLLGWLVSPAGAMTFKVGLVAACAAATLGFATRISMWAAVLLLVVWQTQLRALAGYAGHATLSLIMAAIVLACSPADRALTIWPRRRDDPGPVICQFPLVAILALITIFYLFIGTYRITHGGPRMIASSALTEWILSWSLRQPDPASTLGFLWVSNPFTNTLGKAGFGLLTLLEVATPFCLMSWRFRAAWLPAMFLGHLGILLLMRIDFTPQVLCYLFFLDSRYWSPARVRTAPSVIYFDGFCGLCNGFVDFVLARDSARRFRFAALQGSAATSRFGAAGDVDPTTIILEEDGVVYERSTAALRIIAGLGGVWTLAAVLGLVPRPIRDAVYDWVARNRYAWFGKRDSCRLPTPEERAAFLD